jgi:hypothetical protein
MNVSKPKLRNKLASLSFSEKIKLLEKMRERDRAIAAAGLKRMTARNAEQEGK